MSSISGWGIVFVGVGVIWILRPLIVKLLQQRGVISRSSEQYEIPQHKRIALRIERFGPWFFYLGGICLILFGLALAFAPRMAPMFMVALMGLSLVSIGFYVISAYSRR
jgi:hypothetical protein